MVEGCLAGGRTDRSSVQSTERWVPLFRPSFLGLSAAPGFLGWQRHLLPASQMVERPVQRKLIKGPSFDFHGQETTSPSVHTQCHFCSLKSPTEVVMAHDCVILLSRFVRTLLKNEGTAFCEKGKFSKQHLRKKRKTKNTAAFSFFIYRPNHPDNLPLFFYS